MRIGPLGVWEILAILVVILLVFGPRRLPDALARLLGEDRLRERLRAEGLARAAGFSWRAAAERLVALLPKGDA